MKSAVVYTDGSSGQDRSGGWASLIMTPTLSYLISSSVQDTTNNRMELTAVISALHEFRNPHFIFLVSDSSYIINTLNKKWYKRWFAEPDGRPNLDLWEELIILCEKHTVMPVKVKGHSGNYFNTLVDKKAQEARQGQELFDRIEIEINANATP